MNRILTFCLILVGINCQAQSLASNSVEDISEETYLAKVKFYDVKSGLASNVVNTGMQGKDGFVWLGTREGLVRFDGKEFICFNHKNGLVTNNVTTIKQLQGNRLWLICGESAFDPNYGGTVVIFNTISQTAMPLSNEYPGAKNLLFKDMKTLGDTAMVLYSTDNSFYTFSEKMGFKKLIINFITDNNYALSPDGKIWISVQNHEKGNEIDIYCMNFDGEMLHNYKSTHESTTAFYITGFNEMNLPVGLLKGYKNQTDKMMVLTMDGQLKHLNPAFEIVGSLKEFHTSYGCSFQDGNATRHVYRPTMGAFLNVDNYGKTRLLFDSSVYSAIPALDLRTGFFTTSQNQLWFCTSIGLFKVIYNKAKFKKYLESDKPSVVNSVREITRLHGDLYASADHLGVVRICPNKPEIVVYKHPSIVVYSTNESILFTHDFTLFSYEPKSDVKVFANMPSELWERWVIYTDTAGRMWYGGYKHMGISDGFNKPIRYLDMDFGGRNATVYQIFQKFGYYWFVSSTGVFKYNERTKELKRLNGPEIDGKEVLGDVHHANVEEQQWWFSTNGNGLVKWDIRSNAFVQYTTANGISSNVLYASLSDNFGNIWISSNYGLMQLNKQTNSINTYVKEDGITNVEFNRNSYFKDTDGTLYFGGMNGFIGFNPADFNTNESQYKARLQISEYAHYNEQLQSFEDLTTVVRKNNRIVLEPNSRYFTLKVNLLDFVDDEKKYLFQIVGYQPGWVEVESNMLQIGGLPFGTFKLRIKGQNQRGQWSSDQLELDLLVKKPFYLKWSFIIMVAFLLALLIYGIIKWRTYQLTKNQIQLQNTVKEQTAAINQSLKEKDLLLKEVHHRVKNNLQIISSLLNLERTAGHDDKTMVLLQEARLRIKSMALIHQNLYQNEDLSKIIVMTYFSDLMTSIHHSFHGSSILIDHEVKSQINMLSVDYAIPMGLIINELVTNSYKYAFAGRLHGKICVEISELDDKIHLEVADDGVGIPDQYLALQSQSLGLRLVAMLIKQLKGSYEIININGTRFIFDFEYNRNRIENE